MSDSKSSRAGIIMGATRAGMGVGLVLPALLRWKRSVPERMTSGSEVPSGAAMPDLQLSQSSSRPSCGLVAQGTDSVERLGFIAIRYRAWIGEALAFPFISDGQPTRQRLVTLHGTFDVIEHLAQDLLDAPLLDQVGKASVAGRLMDAAAGMKRMLTTYAEELTGLLVPSVADIEQLYAVCLAMGGRPTMFDGI